jgi:ADP-ribose pyrophosphatase
MPMSARPELVETLVEPRTLLEGGFLTVRKDTVRLPDGATATREYVVHPGAVAVVPLLDDARAVLVRQYRYPLRQLLLEFPAGKRDPGETVLACAMRELEEETGYRALQWARGGMFHNAAAYSTEGIEIWFARGLVAGAQRLDEGEFLEVVEMGDEELATLARDGGLTDAKTLIGLHWWRQWRQGCWPLAWGPAGEGTLRP